MRKILKRKTIAKMQELVISKRFYYGLIAVFLAVLLFADLYASYSFNNDFAIRFMPTLIGIVFNFAIFIVFFDVREKLEWKGVEDRVKKGIGKEIHHLFMMLTSFCEVDGISGGLINSIQTSSEVKLKWLEQMDKDVVLNNRVVIDLEEKVWTERYLSAFESSRKDISEIEIKYGRFLNPKLRTALMDIQGLISNLWYEIGVGGVGHDHFCSELIIGEIAGRIVTIRESGIDIGF